MLHIFIFIVLTLTKSRHTLHDSLQHLGMDSGQRGCDDVGLCSKKYMCASQIPTLYTIFLLRVIV